MRQSDDPRTCRFEMRVTPEEAQALEELAALRGCSRTEVVNTLVRHALRVAKARPATEAPA